LEKENYQIGDYGNIPSVNRMGLVLALKKEKKILDRSSNAKSLNNTTGVGKGSWPNKIFTGGKPRGGGEELSGKSDAKGTSSIRSGTGTDFV